jgi:hypothetical protein
MDLDKRPLEKYQKWISHFDRCLICSPNISMEMKFHDQEELELMNSIETDAWISVNNLEEAVKKDGAIRNSQSILSSSA